MMESIRMLDCLISAVILLTFKYAIVKSGNNVNGTKYKSAGWAALKISELTVAVNKPRKYLNKKTKKSRMVKNGHSFDWIYFAITYPSREQWK